jgi:hypothetical protein
MYTLLALDIPYTQGAIGTAAEQVVAIGCEGKLIDFAGMSVQGCSISTLFHIPEPDCFLIATGKSVSIGTPGKAPGMELREPGE